MADLLTQQCGCCGKRFPGSQIGDYFDHVAKCCNGDEDRECQRAKAMLRDALDKSVNNHVGGYSRKDVEKFDCQFAKVVAGLWAGYKSDSQLRAEAERAHEEAVRQAREQADIMEADRFGAQLREIEALLTADPSKLNLAKLRAEEERAKNMATQAITSGMTRTAGVLNKLANTLGSVASKVSAHETGEAVKDAANGPVDSLGELHDRSERLKETLATAKEISARGAEIVQQVEQMGGSPAAKLKAAGSAAAAMTARGLVDSLLEDSAKSQAGIDPLGKALENFDNSLGGKAARVMTEPIHQIGLATDKYEEQLKKLQVMTAPSSGVSNAAASGTHEPGRSPSWMAPETASLQAALLEFASSSAADAPRDQSRGSIGRIDSHRTSRGIPDATPKPASGDADDRASSTASANGVPSPSSLQSRVRVFEPNGLSSSKRARSKKLNELVFPFEKLSPEVKPREPKH